jgi:hypothetical protein
VIVGFILDPDGYNIELVQMLEPDNRTGAR